MELFQIIIIHHTHMCFKANLKLIDLVNLPAARCPVRPESACPPTRSQGRPSRLPSTVCRPHRNSICPAASSQPVAESARPDTWRDAAAYDCWSGDWLAVAEVTIRRRRSTESPWPPTPWLPSSRPSLPNLWWRWWWDLPGPWSAR